MRKLKFKPMKQPPKKLHLRNEDLGEAIADVMADCFKRGALPTFNGLLEALRGRGFAASDYRVRPFFHVLKAAYAAKAAQKGSDHE